MDRSLSGTASDAHSPIADKDAFLLPSRKQALASCVAGMGEGLVVITGEPGVGKTWLAGRLASQVGSRWVFVDTFPGMGSHDFFAAINDGLAAGTDATRAGVRSALAELSADGRAISLAIDECHLASADLLEEIRVLSNRLKKPDGFAAMVLIGQTRLTLRVDSGSLRSLESRVAARIHLRRLDVDEAASLLRNCSANKSCPDEHVEIRHRDAEGNPRRLLRLSDAVSPRPGSIALEPTDKGLSTPTEEAATAPEPIVVGPAKPPLRMEEGLIEVGYDPVFDVDDVAAVGPRPPSPSEGSDERPIVDHYAALQAWDEWARNQRRDPIETSRFDENADASPAPIGAEGDEEDEDPSSSHSWAEDGQAFAPYSQLFSRMKAASQPE